MENEKLRWKMSKGGNKKEGGGEREKKERKDGSQRGREEWRSG